MQIAPALAIVCSLVLCSIACGDDSSDTFDAGDLDVATADAAAPCELNHRGCEPDERCQASFEPDGTFRTECIPDGTIAPGGACTLDADGMDDCMRLGERSLVCSSGRCTLTCGAGAPCGETGACHRVATGTPLPLPWTSVCTPTCEFFSHERCEPDERCRSFPDSRVGVIFSCVPDGTIPPGGACTLDAEGRDDCMRMGEKNFACDGSLCAELCPHESYDASDVCGERAICLGARIEGRTPGFCTPTCDLIAQDCGSGRACYLPREPSETPDTGACLPPGSDTLTQDQPCPVVDGQSVANGCAAGFDCLTRADGVESCAAYCRPSDTHIGATDQAHGVSPDTCAETEQCRFLSTSGHVVDLLLDVGFCVTLGSDAARGDCQNCDVTSIETFIDTCGPTFGCVSSALINGLYVAGETVCDDGRDPDLDGLVDCDDPDCLGVPPCP